MFAIWGLFLATLFLAWYWNKSGKKLKPGLKELPGPKGLPLIGNALKLGGHQYKQFSKWADEYGNIYQVKAASVHTVIISDAKLCKEIFNEPLASGRFLSPIFDLYEDKPGLGIINSEGELWAVHRRFLLRHLRDFGFGKSSIETSIMEEVNEVIRMFKQKAGTPVGEIRAKMRLAMVNSLWQMLSSERFDQTDPRLTKLANNTSEKFEEILKRGAVLLFMPWVRYIFPELSGYTAIREVLKENQDIMWQRIQEYKKNFKADEEPKDFLGVYFAEMKKQEGDPTSQFYGKQTEYQLAAICFDMFQAGSDTTATTSAWTFLYLCKFPDVQKKFQQEITDVTGDTRHVSLADRPNMPYTLALIDEILRFSTLVRGGVPHRVMEDMEFHGYHIPKESLILPALHKMHFNKNVWEDPDTFRPERFLSEDGKKYVKSENLQPFQIGRRQCLGESLARDNLFLFLTNIFQRFSVKLDPSEKDPGFEGEVGFICAPFPFKVIMTDRLT